MKLSRIAVTFLFIILGLAFSAVTFAQREGGGREGGGRQRGRFDYSEMLTRTMEEAGCPLSEKQIEDVKKLQPGPDMQKRLERILSKEQLAVLEKRDHDRRLNSMIRTLSNTDFALSDEQQKKLKAVKPGSNSGREIGKILTDEQKAELQKATERPRGGRGDFMGRFAEMLKEAGHPLTDEQTKKLGELEREPEYREKMNEILTEEQRKAMEGMFQNRGNRGNRNRQNNNSDN